MVLSVDCRLCLDDQRVANRLKNRREILCTKMLPKLALYDQADTCNVVWVETSFLRQFLSCEELLSENPGTKTILQHRKLLCSHVVPGLHPRIARRGKLLPKEAYDAFIATIQAEIITLFGTDCLDWIINDCEITPCTNLVCKECMQEYKTELGETLELAKNLKFLFDILDPKEMKFSRKLEAGEAFDSQNDQYAYMVSRKFISWFRNKMLRLMKQSGNTATDQKLQTSSSVPTQCVSEGLDGLNLTDYFVAKYLTSPSNTLDDDGIAIRVNGPLTCELSYIVLM
jgi:hypothetical protein